MSQPREPEDPTRFGDEPKVEPLDEAPDGKTPSDHDAPTPDSLPPGAAKPEDGEQSDDGGDSDPSP
jgi:hypothetical protein